MHTTNRRSSPKYCSNRILFYTIILICIFLTCLVYNSNLFDLNLYLWRANEDISGYLLKSRCSCRNEIIEINRVYDSNEFPSSQVYYDIQIKHRDHPSRVLKRYRISQTEFEKITVTCDLYSTLRRGYGQKVIGFSLFGKEELYYNFLNENVIRAAKHLPDWVIRVYHDGSIDRSIICQKQCLKQENNSSFYDNIDFCDVEKIPYGFESTWSGAYMIPMSWRWLPIGDDFVDVFVSRDTDSCINEREKAAVDEWMKSNNLFHVMRGKFAIINAIIEQ